MTHEYCSSVPVSSRVVPGFAGSSALRPRAERASSAFCRAFRSTRQHVCVRRPHLTTRMTLESPKESSDYRSRQAVKDEFMAAPIHPEKSVDAALAALIRRGRRMQAREQAREALQCQIDSLEMLTRVRLVDRGRPTSAAFVLIGSHFLAFFLLVSLVLRDVRSISSVVAFLR